MRLRTMAIICTGWLLIIGVGLANRTPSPDISHFDPRLFEAASGFVYHADNIPNRLQGTAFAIRVGSQVLMVTNAHVCKGLLGSPEVLYVTNQEKGTGLYTAILVIDDANDLCLTGTPYYFDSERRVQYPSVPSIPVSFGIDDEVDGREVGQTYITAGHPRGGPIAFQGFVDLGNFTTRTRHTNAFCQVLLRQSGVEKGLYESCITRRETIALSEVCIPGTSGSPVLNIKGQLVGVIHSTNMSDRCYAIPASKLMHLLRDYLTQ